MQKRLLRRLLKYFKLSDDMFEGYFSILTTIFQPILILPAPVAELIIAAFILFIVTLFYKFLVNQNKVRELKTKLKEKQEEAKEMQKTNPKQANVLMSEILKLTNKQFKMNLKPLFFTFILIIILLPWVASVFPGAVVLLPFSLPFFENDFGWLMWYIIISIPLNQLFRKFMGVE